MVKVLIGFGANAPGCWGEPRASLARGIEALSRASVQLIAASHLYATAPHGPGLQQRYLNAVALAASPLPPAVLLRLAKRIEREAGRRIGRKWGPRPLDIDLLDAEGRRIGWPPRRRTPGGLILPHPEMHVRAFVLVPLLDVAPHWRHPVLGLGARTLLARLPARMVAEVRQSLDFDGPAWHKVPERVSPPVGGVPEAFSQPHHR
jgi:2-amino-4-hydroxy-6-hydroxymethyldihydropteridine diphosphokinase